MLPYNCKTDSTKENKDIVIFLSIPNYFCIFVAEISHKQTA
jgi:hypothetical protein